ncbi:MAG: dynamin family protein [Helicobacter sp.]|uniref:dynamin family protein n=1 Tax=Helicobacter sp. TaxID=218 RepID=UPI002A915DC0|nr:dynamin family protein [Helicobacter sp.]MDY5616579.1 dynamin family protein [Helicobacter sp.]
MEWLEENYDQINPLGNLNILNLPPNSCSDILAILLSLSPKSFNLFWQSQTLQNICQNYLQENLNFKLIKQAQLSLLLQLQHSSNNPKIKTILQETLNKLKILNQNQIIEEAHFKHLLQFLSKIPLDSQQIRTTPPTSSIQHFENFFEESLAILENQMHSIPMFADIQKSLQNLLTKTKSQHFSIGITGVLSAGKSTLLNALLGKEILGSSTIPETASLTTLKYNETSYAKINFWSKQEWEDLKNTLEPNYLESLLQNQEFQSFLSQYILDSNPKQSLEIPLEELPKFTSANSPSKLCNLIKETTLFTPLQFLQNQVEIVDTPGLDDPIIQREEITKNYLCQCDLLIHAMNASQSATQLDINFILEALQNSNISRILIILTHADLLSKKDLLQALDYTKETIQSQISTLQDGALLIKRLDFLCLASYPALLCQTNPQKAKELGYTLQESNFNALIEYLQKTLIGSNSTKAKDLIYLATQGFKKAFLALQENLNLEKTLLFSSRESILSLIESTKQEAQKAKDELNSTKQKLQAIQQQLQDYANTATNLLSQKLLEAQNILIERIFEDIMYDYNQNKTPSKERVEKILLQGLKDFLIDILRVYQYNFSQKISQLISQFTLNHSLKLSQIKLNETLILKVKIQILNHISLKHKDTKLLNSLQNAFSLGFESFKESIYNQSKTIQSQLFLNLQNHFNEILEESELILQTKEKILQKSLEDSQNNSENKVKKEQEILALQEQIKNHLNQLQNIQEYATRISNA